MQNDTTAMLQEIDLALESISRHADHIDTLLDQIKAVQSAAQQHTHLRGLRMPDDKSPTAADAVPYTARLDAGEWWDKHRPHVDRMIAGEGPAYPPSGSDQFRPELWRAPHWRWLKGTLKNV